MKTKILLLMLAPLFFAPSLNGQSDSRIKGLFDDYGKRKGSVMVQLASDILSPNTEMKLYKSLTLRATDEVKSTMQSIVEQGMKKGEKLTEIRRNGQLENMAYYTSSGDYYEYILYNNSNGQITVVYIKGKFKPGGLDKELRKLKDLFIYINKK